MAFKTKFEAPVQPGITYNEEDTSTEQFDYHRNFLRINPGKATNLCYIYTCYICMYF